MSDKFDHLSDIAILPRTLGLTGADDGRERRDLLITRCGDREIAIFADEAESVSENLRPTPLPRSPRTVLGVVSVHGHMRIAIDPGPLVSPDAPAGDAPRPSFFVALRGAEQLALAVERVERIVEVFTDTIEEPGNLGRAFRGVIQEDGRIIAVLNVNELFHLATQDPTPA